MAIDKEGGGGQARSLVPLLTGAGALGVGLAVMLLEGDRTDALVSATAIILFGTLLQGVMSALRAISAAVRSGNDMQARSTLRLAAAMAGITALAVGAAVLTESATPAGQNFSVAIGMVLFAGVLNLFGGLVSARYAAAVERRLY